MFLTIRDIFRKKIKVIDGEVRFPLLSTPSSTITAAVEDDCRVSALDESLILARAYHRVPLALDRKTCAAKTEFAGSFSSIRPPITKRLRYRLRPLTGRAAKNSSTVCPPTKSAATSAAVSSGGVIGANLNGQWFVHEYAVALDRPNSRAAFRPFEADAEPSKPVYVETEELYVGGADLEARLCSQPRSEWHEIVRRGLDGQYKGSDALSIKHNHLNKIEQIYNDAEARWLVRYSSRKERARKNIRSWCYDPVYVEFVNPSDRETWEQLRSYLHEYCDVCDYCYEQSAKLADCAEAHKAKKAYLESHLECATDQREVIMQEAEQLFYAILEERQNQRQQCRIDDCLNDYAKNRPPTPDQYQFSTLTRTWSDDRIQRHWSQYKRRRQIRVNRAMLMQRLRNFMDRELWKRKLRFYGQCFRPSYYTGDLC
ncbi:hypothetical protein POJ06DRAFT_248451 [Lipomyces tetrasporus]|uniref:Uncharacterized protein n=1 Tax=Lipomyces tetrasporus TaxID=54092 RepID=A0AAD7VUM7_9ASCO|nr:uncharacterized protein POJ06DRAFT_248451 [Lipomyces tetrasporus]KAJ8101994.1 hypothetical protein POJ06DRAFT_248451 [Lipomyces tetrasporus]